MKEAPKHISIIFKEFGDKSDNYFKTEVYIKFVDVFNFTAPILSKYFEDKEPPYDFNIIEEGENIKRQDLSGPVLRQFLMPHKVFEKYMQEFDYDTDLLSNKFQVSKEIILIRIKEVLEIMYSLMDHYL